MDEAVRGFYTAVLEQEDGKRWKLLDRDVSLTKDLVLTLEELKRMIDVSDIT